MYAFRHAPAELLEAECHPTCLFSLDHARSLPRPQLELGSRDLGGGLIELEATMRNLGYLPTDVTAHARKNGRVRPTHLELELTGDAVLERGQLHQRCAHLDGYARVHALYPSSFTTHGSTRTHERRVRWLVRGSGRANVTWRGDRIGVHRASIDTAG